MSEQRAAYSVNDNLLPSPCKPAKLNTEIETVRVQLVDLECQLVSLLVTVQRALGKEPSVMTRRERRRG